MLVSGEKSRFEELQAQLNVRKCNVEYFEGSTDNFGVFVWGPVV